MPKCVNLEEAYDQKTLTDWYISSVDDNQPVWTEAHIEELLEDFYVIPKTVPLADTAPVVYGWWEKVDSSYWRWTPSGATVVERITWRCSRCARGAAVRSDFCPKCGAKMSKDNGKNGIGGSTDD